MAADGRVGATDKEACIGSAREDDAAGAGREGSSVIAAADDAHVTHGQGQRAGAGREIAEIADGRAVAPRERQAPAIRLDRAGRYVDAAAAGIAERDIAAHRENL